MSCDNTKKSDRATILNTSRHLPSHLHRDIVSFSIVGIHLNWPRFIYILIDIQNG